MRATRIGWSGIVLLAGTLAVSATQMERAQTPGASPPAAAQQSPPAPPAPALQAAPLEQGETGETLHLLAGRSLVITSPARIKRIAVADPNTLDALAVTPYQLVVSGKTPGASSLVIWDETGQNQTFDVLVDVDVMGLRERIHEALPDEPIQVEATRGVVTLTGHVSSQDVADRIVAIAQAMVPNKADVVSLLQTPVALTSGEVLLQVKFADVDRTTLSQLGANLISLPGAKNVVTTSTGEFSPPSLSSVGAGQTSPINLASLLNVFMFRPDINLAATIQALEQKNVLEILAEPNVLAETGKEASFLAGGEFPFPVVQGTSGIPVVTIQFREFGVRLVFTPLITPDGLIHLKVAPEVSSLDFTNSLTISGFTIPSLSTRKVQSEMVLRDGQSFAIAGLMNDQVTNQMQKIPGIGDIPILGKLFRSRSVNKTHDELLIMVTPRIVQLNSPPPLPPTPRPDVPFLRPGPAPKPASGGAK
ncbi:MAG TPA: type II and III secretion system protein family protein [Terriglobia bacterium]|nr:type II and III secretion system protein family protein [Terriglobia bacterium]